MLFDFVLIGAGPCAVAALSALPPGKKTLVVTGTNDRLEARRARFVHAKIDSVAHENGEPAGVAQRIPFARPKRGELIRSSIVGGLANYWGQQFARYEANDPWPRETFSCHAEYLTACGKIEELFHCSPGHSSGEVQHLGSGYGCRMPNLVLGSAADPGLGLMSMQAVFNSLVVGGGATVLHHAAVSWEVMKDSVRVLLSDGSVVQGRRVLLAAGAVGTLQVVMASCPEVHSTTFGDHSPVMLYTTLKSRSLPMVRADGVRHFNALAVEKIVGGRVESFASLYKLSDAPLSLLLAMLKLPLLIRRLRIPRIMDLLTPVQLWTEATQMRYRLVRDEPHALVDVPSADCALDSELNCFLNWLKQHARIWKTTVTVPGGGFHFCAGRVQLDDGGDVPLVDYLQETQNSRISVLDGAALPALGCRPSALTMMANSRQTMERLLQN